MNIEYPTDTVIARACEILREGGLVAFPTETVYGLGADATNDRAVAEIFALKGRPQFNPLIVHVSGVTMAKRIVTWNAAAEKLAAAFWAGPLTLVLARAPDCAVSLLASAGGDTIGVRMPCDSIALHLIKAAGTPLAAPSANRSGRVSPTTAQHVAEEFADAVPLIIEGGACALGIESTVIDLSAERPVLLRPGSVTAEMIEVALGYEITTSDVSQGTLKSPGQLASHYAPSLPVRLNVTQPRDNEALLAFGADVPGGAKTTFNLSAAGDLREAAAHLFAALRALDTPEHSAIAVMPIPDTDVGKAINDRLRRASMR